MKEPLAPNRHGWNALWDLIKHEGMYQKRRRGRDSRKRRSLWWHWGQA